MKNLTFNITDHNDEDVCTSSYQVEYRAAGQSNYQRLSPDPHGPNITIPLLTEGQSYLVQVRRNCCDGVASVVASFTVTIPE